MSKKKKRKGTEKAKPGADTLKRRAEHQKKLTKHRVRLTAEERHYMKTGRGELSPSLEEERRETEKEAQEARITLLMGQEPARPTKRKGTSNKGVYFYDPRGMRRTYKRKKNQP